MHALMSQCRHLGIEITDNLSSFIHKCFDVLLEMTEIELRPWMGQDDTEENPHRDACHLEVTRARDDMLNKGIFNNQTGDLLVAAAAILTKRTIVVLRHGVLSGDDIHLPEGQVTPELYVHRGAHPHLVPIILHLDDSGTAPHYRSVLQRTDLEARWTTVRGKCTGRQSARRRRKPMWGGGGPNDSDRRSSEHGLESNHARNSAPHSESEQGEEDNMEDEVQSDEDNDEAP
jgi:hypothetical protein